jgi:hypothetical protein
MNMKFSVREINPMRFRILSIFMLTSLLLGLAVNPGRAQSAQETPTSEDTPAATINSTLTVDPASASSSATPGSFATYQLNVTNPGTDAVDVTVVLMNTSTDFTAVASPSSFSIGAGQTQPVTISVGVGSTAQAGYNNTTSVNFGEGAAATLYTSVVAPAATATPAPDGRPSIVLESYGVTGDVIKPGQEFDLTMKIKNIGREYAEAVTFTFSGADFLPVSGGGMTVLNEVDPGEEVTFKQRFIAASTLTGSSVATLPVALAYSSLSSSTAYTDSLTLTIRLDKASSSSGSGGYAATRTPTQVARPQLVVSGYKTNVDPLQPGATFELELNVQNLGSADARSVTMVLGGGTTSTDSSGTPVPGGEVSGSSGDLSTFAPLGSSNLVYIGDIPQGTTITSKQKLIVNVTANPGAYSFKISFVYDDAKGNRLVNDQVITLLIYQLPQVEINFYRDAGIFYTGQMGSLPLQVTNLGKKSSVLGNMTVSAENADITNGVSLVGALDPGGYYTLDANIIPYQSGPLELQVSVNYTDDFNQSRTINQTLTINVEDMPTPEVLPPGEGGMPDPGMQVPQDETLWQKIVRAVKGFFGLDSAQDTNNNGGTIDTTVPMDGMDSEKPVEVVPVPKG